MVVVIREMVYFTHARFFALVRIAELAVAKETCLVSIDRGPIAVGMEST